MSENITTETDTAAQVPAAGTLEHLDPQTLELETNVRDDAALDADFVASIKEHGVLNPIAAVRGHDGVVRVRAGQRRTLAAREAGLTSVPVYVRHEYRRRREGRGGRAGPGADRGERPAPRAAPRPSGHAAFSRCSTPGCR